MQYKRTHDLLIITVLIMLAMAVVCTQAFSRTTGGYPLDLDFWTQNQVVREATLYQCRRRGPGDELVYMYCGIASKAALIVAQQHTTQPSYYQQPTRYYQAPSTDSGPLAGLFRWLQH